MDPVVFPAVDEDPAFLTDVQQVSTEADSVCQSSQVGTLRSGPSEVAHTASKILCHKNLAGRLLRRSDPRQDLVQRLQERSSLFDCRAGLRRRRFVDRLGGVSDRSVPGTVQTIHVGSMLNQATGVLVLQPRRNGSRRRILSILDARRTAAL